MEEDTVVWRLGVCQLLEAHLSHTQAHTSKHLERMDPSLYFYDGFGFFKVLIVLAGD